ncbi:MAG: hypothetical protein A2Y97_05575 [Nitrospirae bacterium RBG_13_39_12]|nr:MAG: hypothetical protein A2Y97_05575 [Nitrospirae bacterium RBG_13_39_12]
MNLSYFEKMRYFLFRFIERGLFLLFNQKNAIMIEEYMVSFFPSLAKEYCLTRETVTSNEIQYLKTLRIENYEAIVIVGGGATPFTAIHWASLYPIPVVVLDKSKLAKEASEKLIRKLGFKNIKIINQYGEDYNGYKNCIIIISLYADNKEMILKKILENAGGKIVIFLRSFIDEQHDSLIKKWQIIDQNANFRTLVTVIN